MTPIDAELAAMGYLVSADRRRWRYVHGLGGIVRDGLTLSATLWWAPELGARAGGCDLLHHRVLLAPWLIDAWPWLIRDVVGHEVAHVAVGRSQARARQWQGSRYS